MFIIIKVSESYGHNNVVKKTKLQSAMISFRGTEIGCRGRWGTCIDSTLTGKRPCQRQRDSAGRREKIDFQ